MRLALEAGAPVSAERLVEDLWMDAAAETRRNTLQSKIAMLRRALGASTVVSRDGGYALAVDESQVDALVVLRQADAAVRLRGRETPTVPRPHGDDTGAFRGTGLALGDADWADVYRTRSTRLTASSSRSSSGRTCSSATWAP